MGAPTAPNDEQYAALVAAGQLTALGPPRPVAVADGVVSLSLELPRQAVALVVLEP